MCALKVPAEWPEKAAGHVPWNCFKKQVGVLMGEGFLCIGTSSPEDEFGVRKDLVVRLEMLEELKLTAFGVEV